MHQVGHVFVVRQRQFFRVDVVGAGIGADTAFTELVAIKPILFDPARGGGLVPINAAGFETQHVVEAPLRRVARGQELAPLANHRGGVTGLLQDRGNHDFGVFAGADDGSAGVLRDGTRAIGVTSEENEGA